MAMRAKNSGQLSLEPGGTVKCAGDVESGRAFDCNVFGLIAFVEAFLDEAWVEGGAFWEVGELGPGQDAGLHSRLALFPAFEVGDGGLNSGQLLLRRLLVVSVALTQSLREKI